MRIRARKVTIDNIKFDSAGEAERYQTLKLHQKLGYIRGLKVHTKYALELNGRPLLVRSEGYPNGRRSSYTSDFDYEEKQEDGTWVFITEDFKGYDTHEMRFKRAVFELLYGRQIRVTH